MWGHFTGATPEGPATVVAGEPAERMDKPKQSMKIALIAISGGIACDRCSPLQLQGCYYAAVA
jgi:hypothetical protein